MLVQFYSMSDFLMYSSPKMYYYSAKVRHLGVFHDFISHTFHKSSFYFHDAGGYCFNLDSPR